MSSAELLPGSQVSASLLCPPRMGVLQATALSMILRWAEHLLETHPIPFPHLDSPGCPRLQLLLALGAAGGGARGTCPSPVLASVQDVGSRASGARSWAAARCGQQQASKCSDSPRERPLSHNCVLFFLIFFFKDSYVPFPDLCILMPEGRQLFPRNLAQSTRGIKVRELCNSRSLCWFGENKKNSLSRKMLQCEQQEGRSNLERHGILTKHLPFQARNQMFKDRKLFEKEQEVTRKQKEAVSLSRRSGLDMLLLKAGGKDGEAQASRREMVSHHLEMS